MAGRVDSHRVVAWAREAGFEQVSLDLIYGTPGETIEDCVRREVREEVNVEIGPPAYFASQSWAFPHSLMIAYTAHYAGGDLRPDRTEIADARWFGVNALPDLPSGVSSDDGALLSPIPHADLCVTFGALKPAHVLMPAMSRIGLACA